VAAAGAAVAAAAGVVAGVVGLGGGTMVAPILLEFRIHPQVRWRGNGEGKMGRTASCSRGGGYVIRIRKRVGCKDRLS
jgi:hypothetical protein